MNFVCPICLGAMAECGGAARCERAHSFDKSRFGYYNLLVGRGGAHGDNKDMVAARRAFLASGEYEPLARRIAALVAERTKGTERTEGTERSAGGVVLDAGCGEGYYTAFVKAALSGAARVLAFDISKDAVREAARIAAADEYAVASSYKIPLSDGGADTVINIFSPLALDEMRRVIRPGGSFIMAIPGEEHLFGLKAAVYDTPYKNTPEDTDIPGFKLTSREELRYSLNLDSAEKIRALFMMTPYAYRTGERGRARVHALSSLECEAHFYVLVYEREV